MQLSRQKYLIMGKNMKKQKNDKNGSIPKCGLCGKTENLTKTECCDQWICDDEDAYVAFSYAANSCHRNHKRYTLCAYHHNEGHSGDWRTCQECKDDFETEDYVYYATNDFNFKKLENPPEFEPTRCIKCNEIINRGYEGFTKSKDGYICLKCFKI